MFMRKCTTITRTILYITADLHHMRIRLFESQLIQRWPAMFGLSYNSEKQLHARPVSQTSHILLLEIGEVVAISIGYARVQTACP
jgi:hypothetical protein